jgi:hypothetical protein
MAVTYALIILLIENIPSNVETEQPKMPIARIFINRSSLICIKH